jgi:hypothetical protein
MSQVAIIEMVPPVLRRAPRAALASFRTLDAISPTAIEFIHAQGAGVQLASYNERLLGAAHLLCIPEWDSSGREQTRGPRTVNA